MELINSKNSYPNLGGEAVVEETTVSLDPNGDGSATVTWSDPLPGTVFALATGRGSGAVHISAAGNSQATVQVEGGTADGSLTVNVLGVGISG